MTAFDYSLIGKKVWNRYKVCNLPAEYTTILVHYGALRLAEVTGDGAMRQEILSRLEPYWKGLVPKVAGHYGQYDYRFGGNASAWALFQGYLGKEAEESLSKACEDLIAFQPRYENKIFCQRKWHDLTPGEWGFRWIDTVFGVCPFLLWIGLKCNKPRFIDEAAAQMRYHHELLFDPACNLYHQAIDARLPEITPGHWGRGVGWALHALTDLAGELPGDHKEYSSIVSWYRMTVDGCLNFQDKEGMWHQNVDDFGTFPEASGTGLILYALGKGIRNGIFTDEKYLTAFRRGIASLMGYVGLDGSVHHCCGGCCCPGYNGTAADYEARGYILNDSHSFGPVTLACSEAVALEKEGIL